MYSVNTLSSSQARTVQLLFREMGQGNFWEMQKKQILILVAAAYVTIIIIIIIIYAI